MSVAKQPRDNDTSSASSSEADPTNEASHGWSTDDAASGTCSDDTVRHDARRPKAAWAEEPQPSIPEQIVDTMNVLFGKHPGFRAAHAKGIVCEGEFTPRLDSAATCREPLTFRASPCGSTVRFSDSTGIPDIPDGVPTPARMGWPSSSTSREASTDIVANAFNGFAVATPEDFLAFLKAVSETRPNAPKPTPIEKFLGSHPKAMKVVPRPRSRCRSASPPSPTSVSTRSCSRTRRARPATAATSSILTRGGFLTAEEAAKKSPTFLIDELGDRLAKGPVTFRLRRPARGRGRPGERRDGRLAR